MLAAVEGPVGHWRMIDPQGTEYGRIEIRRVDDGARIVYKATRNDETLGWATSLRVACERVHRDFLRAMMPGGGPQADWGDLTGNARRRGGDSRL